MNKVLTILFFLVCQGFYSQIQIVSPPIKEKSDFFLCVRNVEHTDAPMGNNILFLIPINNVNSISLNELLNDFDNRIVFSLNTPFLYEQFTKKNEPIKVDNDSTFMIDSLLSYPLNQKPIFHFGVLHVYLSFVNANVEYRIVKNITNFSYLKFNLNDNNTSIEYIKLPKFYDMKVLTGFTWKNDSLPSPKNTSRRKRLKKR